MNVNKSEDFISDLERQFQWYAVNAGWEIAERYLASIEATSQLLGLHPLLGLRAGFSNPRLSDWRFIVVFRPFQKHVLFYETNGNDVSLRRAMHRHRDLPRRLLEPPGTE
jgi:plasmid stabilization system protein ParE